jgi:integrase
MSRRVGVYHRLLPRSFASDLRRSGGRASRFHSLRHTHATLVLAADVDLKAISRRPAHVTIQSIINLYPHVVAVVGTLLVC